MPDSVEATSSMFVWLVRILLPIIFFFVWYGGQGKDEEGPSGPTVSKQEMLEQRAAVKKDPAPHEVSNIKLVSAEDSRLGAAGGAARTGRANQVARAKRGPRDQAGKSDGIVRQESGYTDIDGPGTPVNRTSAEDLSPPMDIMESPVAKTGLASLNDEELMHFEAMLNFVGLNNQVRPQRVFLPTPEHPPPPPRRPPVAADSPSDDNSSSLMANVDAQKVLKALVNDKLGFKSNTVAKDLYEELEESNVIISEQTFTLMVEACLKGGDLKGASEFLMKMESAGLTPDSDLLDKVMDLYSESRSAANEVDAGASTPSRPKPWANSKDSKKGKPWNNFDDDLSAPLVFGESPSDGSPDQAGDDFR